MIKAINRSIAARHEEDEKGFTLIELLVVILIIGVLAAIAIPAFLNQRQGAWVSQVESDLKNAALAVEQYSVNNNGDIPDPATDGTVSTDGVVTAGSVWETSGFNGTDDVNVAYAAGANAGEYVLTATHEQMEPATKTWTYNSADGKITAP